MTSKSTDQGTMVEADQLRPGDWIIFDAGEVDNGGPFKSGVIAARTADRVLVHDHTTRAGTKLLTMVPSERIRFTTDRGDREQLRPVTGTSTTVAPFGALG
jgi:hypothetical protein